MYSTFKNNLICLNFLISFNGNTTKLAVIRHVPWAINASKMRLWPELHGKSIFGVFRAQGTCLVAANIVLSAVGS